MLRYIASLVLALLTSVSQAQILSVVAQVPFGTIIMVGQWITDNPDPVYYIEVVGVGSTVEESKLNGFRLAVEQAVGSVIASETVVNDARLTRDEIISYASGYVTRFDIVDQTYNANNAWHTTMKVWIKKSILANRLLHESSNSGDLEGAKAAVNLSSFQYEREQGDRLVGTVLNDFYRMGMNIDLKPARISFDNERNGLVEIPFRLSWDSKYISSLTLAYQTTAQNSSYNPCRINCKGIVSNINISGLVLQFSDTVKAHSLIDVMILSQPQIELTLSSLQDQVVIKQCFHWPELDHMENGHIRGGYFVSVSPMNPDNVAVNGNFYMNTAIQIKTNPEQLKLASKVQLKLVPAAKCPA
jgi:hypothetical protein